MIGFVTLLLGLVVGAHTIEVSVSGPVARVELLLDGVKAGERASPPWRIPIDLGAALAPHELVAQAFDAEGKPLASTTQWINLPRPQAEVEVVLETPPNGQPAAARLAWQSFDNSPPSEIELKLDNTPLALDANQRAPLPSIDMRLSHVLSAELQFGPGVVGRRDVVLGGSYGSELATELTAVPLRVQGKATKELPPSALQGRLAARGEALTVAAVEEGPAKVLVVSAVGPTSLFDRFFPDLLASRAEMRFDDDTRVSFVSPGARRVAGPVVNVELFDMTRDFERKDGGLPFLVAMSAFQLWRGVPTPRVVDAVAVAGLRAAAENRRRAVVLLLSDSLPGRESDASRFTAQQVRSYLGAIGVPLHVWNATGSQTDPLAKVWGEAEDVSTLLKLRRAYDKLNEDLASQRIALVEGRHLLRAVELKPGDAAVQTLGGGAEAPAIPPSWHRP